jgi:hypothetical protein
MVARAFTWCPLADGDLTARAPAYVDLDGRFSAG